MKVKFKPGAWPEGAPFTPEKSYNVVEKVDVHGIDYVKVEDDTGQLWSYELERHFEEVADEKIWTYDFVTAKAPNAAAAQGFLQQQLKDVIPKLYLEFEVLSFFSWVEAEQQTKSGIVKGAPVPVFCLCAGMKVVRHDIETEKKLFEEMASQPNGTLVKM